MWAIMKIQGLMRCLLKPHTYIALSAVAMANSIHTVYKRSRARIEAVFQLLLNYFDTFVVLLIVVWNLMTINILSKAINYLTIKSKPEAEPTTNDLKVNSAESIEWQRTIETVVQSVVSLNIAQLFPFELGEYGTSVGTGFIVDAKQGIILTNRHVVGSGPFLGYAVFNNHEQCDVTLLYSDPVHDFAFLKFDPSRLKYMAGKLAALKLCPELAKVGSEIRIVGNNANDKLSILAGFISRLDRNVPDMPALTYTDFNTEYIQASCNATGGSSGSPVIDIHGNVIGLKASGKAEASTDFFLPLARPLRTLSLLQKKRPVTRGTIQVKWSKVPYEMCARIGISDECEQAMRRAFPASFGMLVAQTILPQGPGDGLIEVSDCLISINGELVNNFAQVDEILDSSVDQDIFLGLQRAGKDITLAVQVGDLHAITPSKFVSINGAMFQNVGYQIAQRYSRPIEGVFISRGSPTLEESDFKLLLELDHKPVHNVDKLIELVRSMPSNPYVVAKTCALKLSAISQHPYFCLCDTWEPRLKIYTLNASTGLWDIEEVAAAPPPKQPCIRSATFSSTGFANPKFDWITHGFAIITFIDPYDGSQGCCSGFVIDPQNGFILVTEFPYPLEITYISFAQSVEIPGKVIFVHPQLRLSIVSYDPKLVDIPLEAIQFSPVPAQQGDKLTFIGVTSTGELVSSTSKVTHIFFDGFINTVILDSEFSELRGVLVNEDGHVCAMKGNDYTSEVLPIMNMLQKLRDGSLFRARHLPMNYDTAEISSARRREVPEGKL